MEKHFYTLVFILALQAIGVQKVTAQTDSCIIKLKNANTGFDQGDYDGTIKLIRSTLAECNLSKDDKIQANKLLIMSYLKVDNLEEADKAAAEIMKINPYYKPDKFKDDPKLSTLFEKYKPTPVFKIGFSGGFNIANVDVVQPYSIVHNDNTEGLNNYKNKAGWQLRLNAEYRILKNIWLGLGGAFRETKYEHILDSVENTTIIYSEKLSGIDVPFSVKYFILDKTISPYIEAGVNFSILTGALSNTTRDDLTDLVNRKALRNKFSLGYFVGIGAITKMNVLQLCVNVRYNYYPEIVNKEGTRYADPVNVFKYYYIDDDFRMNNWQINVGVNYNLSYQNIITVVK